MLGADGACRLVFRGVRRPAGARRGPLRRVRRLPIPLGGRGALAGGDRGQRSSSSAARAAIYERSEASARRKEGLRIAARRAARRRAAGRDRGPDGRPPTGSSTSRTGRRPALTSTSSVIVPASPSSRPGRRCSTRSRIRAGSRSRRSSPERPPRRSSSRRPRRCARRSARRPRTASPTAVGFVVASVFDELRVLRDQGRRYDVVVLDPPKFVHSAEQVSAGSRGYKDVNMLGFELVRPGGLLATFSCSGHVDGGPVPEDRRGRRARRGPRRADPRASVPARGPPHRDRVSRGRVPQGLDTARALRPPSAGAVRRAHWAVEVGICHCPKTDDDV